jgi:hypothetical protein
LRAYAVGGIVARVRDERIFLGAVLAVFGASLAADIVADFASKEVSDYLVERHPLGYGISILLFLFLPMPGGPPPDPTERPLCPRCFKPNRPADLACRRCSAPISPLACIDPVAQARAGGWAIGETIRRERPGGVVASAAWLLGGPYLVAHALLVYLWLSEPRFWVAEGAPLAVPVEWIAVAEFTIVGVFLTWGLFQVTRHRCAEVRHRRRLLGGPR